MKIIKTKTKQRIQNSFFLSKEVKTKLLKTLKNFNKKQLEKLNSFFDKADIEFRQLFDELPEDKKHDFMSSMEQIIKKSEKSFFQDSEKSDRDDDQKNLEVLEETLQSI